jgi:hypothetical protein
LRILKKEVKSTKTNAIIELVTRISNMEYIEEIIYNIFKPLITVKKDKDENGKQC